MSAFSERLVTQRLKHHQRKLDFDLETARLEGKTQQLEELQARLKTAQEQHQRVEEIRISLEKLNAETEEQYNAAQKKDEEERLLLSAELKKKIEVVNDMTSSVAEDEIKVSHASRALKEQMEIYEKHGSAGREKYDELMHVREGELEKIKDKQVKDAEMVPELQKMLESESADLEIARKEHAELKGKVDVYLGRFATIQEQLNKSKEVYEVAKSDKDRQIRQIRALESDCQQVNNRLQRSRTERNKEFEKVRVLDEKLEDLQKQTERFCAMTTMFENLAEEPQQQKPSSGGEES